MDGGFEFETDFFGSFDPVVDFLLIGGEAFQNILFEVLDVLFDDLLSVGVYFCELLFDQIELVAELQDLDTVFLVFVFERLHLGE